MTVPAAIGLSAALALIVGAVVFRRRFLMVAVRGSSMSPTYADGERILVRRRSRCAPGDVVVFRDVRVDAELDHLVKRVAAVAGEPVPPDLAPAVAEPVVPAGYFLVRGDNRRSLGSRELGLIPLGRLVGVAAAGRVFTES